VSQRVDQGELLNLLTNYTPPSSRGLEGRLTVQQARELAIWLGPRLEAVIAERALPTVPDAGWIAEVVATLADLGWRVRPPQRADIPFELRAEIRQQIDCAGVAHPASAACMNEQCRDCGCFRAARATALYLKGKGLLAKREHWPEELRALLEDD
jgi:hypothetical protein